MAAVREGRQVRSFLVWAVVGALTSFGVLSILTIGPVLLVAAAVLGLLALRWVGWGAGTAGVVVGLGLPLGYVGWLNREGPGEVCHAVAQGRSCTTEWSPWPWYVAAACCVVAGAALHRMLLRRDPG